MTTLEALTKSRDHWIEMRDNKDSFEQPNKNGCALCGLYYHLNCRGCPIAEKTEIRLCKGSPYLKALYAYGRRSYSEHHWELWQEEANKMIQFLEELINEYDSPTT